MICVRCDKDGFTAEELAAHVAVCGTEPVPTVMVGSSPVEDDPGGDAVDLPPEGGGEDLDDGLPEVPGTDAAGDEKSLLVADAMRLGVVNPETGKPGTAAALGRWGIPRLQAAIAEAQAGATE